MLQHSPNSDFQWFSVQHCSRGKIHFWPSQRCKAQGPLQQSPGQQEGPPDPLLSPGWQDTVLRVPGQSWPWGTWGTFWGALARPGMSWHVLTAAGTSWTILDHPGVETAAPNLENTVLKGDGLSCIVGPHSSHFSEMSGNVIFQQKCHIWLFWQYSSWPHIGRQMSQAVRAWNASRPGVAKRKARQISLCSHILYL